jgi:hypothetical protein
MPYTRESIPNNHGEFSGGPGLIDPVLREDRVLTPEQQLMEMYATNPADPSVAALGAGSAGVFEANTLAAEEALKARAAEIELENDPSTTPVPRVQFLADE